MKSIRTRLVVTFIGLMVAMIAVVWGVNQWYLEQYYISEKVRKRQQEERDKKTI